MSHVTSEPTGTTTDARLEVSTDPRPSTASRNRVLAVVALVAVALLLVGASAWATLALRPGDARSAPEGTSDSGVVPVGIPATVPGGTLTVEEVEHVTPDALGGAALPPQSHATQVTLTVSAWNDGPMSLQPNDVTMTGIGIAAPLVASAVTPTSITVPAGQKQTVTLVYAVPDLSAELVLHLPDGVIASAFHADHPGEQH